MSIPMSAPSLQADEPCDPFMAGLTFHHAPVAGKDAADVQEYVKAMQRAGAVVTPHHDARVTHVVLSKTGPAGSEDEALHKAAGRASSRVVSWFWIQECLKANELVPVDDSVLFRPLPSLEGLPEMRDLKVCVTGYTGDRRRPAHHDRRLARRGVHARAGPPLDTPGVLRVRGRQVGQGEPDQAAEDRQPPLARAVPGEVDRAARGAVRRAQRQGGGRARGGGGGGPRDPGLGRRGRGRGGLAGDGAGGAGSGPPRRERARDQRARAPEGSFGTFVTELTAGAAAGAGVREDRGRRRRRRPGHGAARRLLRAGGGGAGGRARGTSCSPAPRAPRSASQSQGKSRGLAPGALLPGSELLSPDWGARSCAPQHIERSRRDVELDPTLLALRDRGEPIARGAARLRGARRVAGRCRGGVRRPVRGPPTGAVPRLRRRRRAARGGGLRRVRATRRRRGLGAGRRRAKRER